MSNKLIKFAQVAGISLALVLTFSCSSGDDGGGSSSSVTDGSGGGSSGGSNSSGDSCDMSSYKKKEMLDGKTWMLENLNCNVAGSECYEKKESYCNKYGRLYSFEAAKKACSGGWHLPTRDEWDALVAAVGGKETAGTKLKATSGWNDYEGKSGNGTDEFDFSALPGGYGSSGGYFGNVGDIGYWWSSTEGYSRYAYIVLMGYYDEYVYWYNGDKGGLFSVRCVQD